MYSQYMKAIYVWIYFTTFCSVSIVDFEKVNASWAA